MKKETVQLTYELCVQHMERWQALGRNYTAVKKGGPVGHPAYIIFHLLNLDTVFTGIRIRVMEGCSELGVEFPPFGGRWYSNDYSYPMDAVPVQPFRNEERVKAWEEFIDAMRTPPPIKNT
jgi:hypothetical protein